MDNERNKCGQCGFPIEADQPQCIYDDELCHLDCAASAEDEADFDNWFVNK